MDGDGEFKVLKWIVAGLVVLGIFRLLSQDVDRTTAMAPDTPSVLMGSGYASP
jgi:hypothetical protein